MEPLSYTDICLFWMQVKKSGHCWEWQGGLTQSGYGRLYLNGKMVRAHRISYFLHKGDIKEKNIICHSCDNPKCVNPEHLWQGSSKDNVQDMIRKGRLVRTRGENKGVTYRKESGKWRARKMINYKNVYLGTFATREEAIEALNNFHPPQ